MADFGYVTVTTACPVTPEDGNTTTRVFGDDEADVYKIVVCPEGHEYGIKVHMEVSGTATVYTLTPGE